LFQLIDARSQRRNLLSQPPDLVLQVGHARTLTHLLSSTKYPIAQSFAPAHEARFAPECRNLRVWLCLGIACVAPVASARQPLYLSCCYFCFPTLSLPS
jgi:hypothetical protein